MGFLIYLMDTMKESFRNLQTQSPEMQATIGAAAGFGTALIIMPIVKSIAFVAGGGILISTALSETPCRFNLEVVDVRLDDIRYNFECDSILKTSFIGGYLLGFSYS